MRSLSSDNRVKPSNRERSRWLAAGGVALALLIAGCGSTYGSSKPSQGPASSAPPAVTGAGASTPSSPTTVETNGIPQSNGGDQDADNNGGPSDGDGNV
jgi:hypothetical protein